MSTQANAPIFSLANKVAIVTGGGTGIGKSIALEFAKAGAEVVVAGRRLHLLEQTAKEVRALGRNSLAVRTDVSRKAEVNNLVQRTIDEFGVIDILVNNAAIYGSTRSIIELPEDEWDMIMDTNLKSYYLCCQAVVKRMVERRTGNIINVSSNGGVSTCGGSSSTPYGISKAGVIRLTKGLAWELGTYNIRVNAIAPGWVKTEMTQSSWSDPETLKWVESRAPLGRIGHPREIASVALFLACEASSFITGETIIADAGNLA